MQTSSSSDLIMFHNILFKLFPQYVAFLYKTYFGISVELHENIRKQLQQKTQKSPKSDLRCPERQIQHIALGVLEEVLEEVNLDLICPPGKVGVMLEDGLADWMTEMHRAELEG